MSIKCDTFQTTIIYIKQFACNFIVTLGFQLFLKIVLSVHKQNREQLTQPCLLWAFLHNVFLSVYDKMCDEITNVCLESV